jgi:hypothetical protein
VFEDNAVSYSSAINFCREAILGLNSKKPYQPLLPKDDGLDERNRAILLALSDEPLSSVHCLRQMARRICVPKSCVNWISSVCRFPAFHSQTSDIFMGFLTSSPTVRRQVKSSRVLDPTSRPPVVHLASWMGIHITSWPLTNKSWFDLSTDQIISDLAARRR